MSDARRTLPNNSKPGGFSQAASRRARCWQCAALMFLCPLQVHEGDRVRLTVFYAHEAPSGGYYVTSEVLDPVPQNGEANVTSEGHPVGARWMVNGVEVKRCGVEYLFADGFESGDTGRWR